MTLSSTKNQILSLVGVVFLGIFGFLLITTLSTFSQYYSHAVEKNKLLNYKKGGLVLSDRSGQEFHSEEVSSPQTYVSLDGINDNVEKAVIAAEDREFYAHDGLSFQGVSRSVFLNLQEGEISYGGSTITQQLTKNTLLTPERTFERKYKELLISFLIENKYPKDEILEMYLNTVYFGQGAYGVVEASEVYFEKDAQDLTLGESAYLAGILSAPSEFSPYRGNMEAGKVRQERVLAQMYEEELVDRQEYEQALSEDIAFVDRTEDDSYSAPHFALHVKDQLRQMYGEDFVDRGLRVKTTLDLGVQRMAQGMLAEHIRQSNGLNAGNGSVVVVEPVTGDVLAMVGSANWESRDDGKYDMARAPRQVGSAFKPIVYALAFENGAISPSTVLADRPTAFDNPDHTDYSPRNYDRRFRGNVLVRQALASSLNVPAVQVMERVGVREVVGASKKFGIQTIDDPSQYGLSLVLGSAEVPLIEMASAYTTFANEGMRPEQHAILEIQDKYGELIYTRDVSSRQVVSSETAYQITSILSDTQARQAVFGDSLNLPFDVALKTGTTDDYKDAWTIGYTPEYVVGVWVGNNNNAPMYNAPGSVAAAPVFKSVMSSLVQNGVESEFDTPQNIVAVPICRYNGMRAESPGSAAATIEYFARGQEPENSTECVVRREEQGAENGADEPAEQSVDDPAVGGGQPPGSPEIQVEVGENSETDLPENNDG